ncbi:MAG: hypothetical protein HKL82_12885 [Acidimicrobiaceae bacterium]|nr:hypothetical protein [Acidimicrobiaceae bacterium]
MVNDVLVCPEYAIPMHNDSGAHAISKICMDVSIGTDQFPSKVEKVLGRSVEDTHQEAEAQAMATTSS